MKTQNFFQKLLSTIDINLNFMKIQKHIYSKRTSKKVIKGLNYYKKNKEIINNVDQNLNRKRTIIIFNGY